MRAQNANLDSFYGRETEIKYDENTIFIISTREDNCNADMFCNICILKY